jgi:hypothetical protein
MTTRLNAQTELPHQVKAICFYTFVNGHIKLYIFIGYVLIHVYTV